MIDIDHIRAGNFVSYEHEPPAADLNTWQKNHEALQAKLVAMQNQQRSKRRRSVTHPAAHRS